MPEPFFFYGSLQDPLILEAVLGRDLSHLTFARAKLADHKVDRAEGYSFPILCPEPNAQAPGTLTMGLTQNDRARIAYFEDSEYDLVLKNVETQFGPQPAQLYFATSKLSPSGEPWTLDEFQRRDRVLLLAVTRFVMTEHYPSTPQAVMEQIWASIHERIAREIGYADKA